MTETPSPSDADRGFEMALRSLSPVGPAGAASDAAYEAGLSDGAAQQRNVLWVHRLASAAAIVVAALLGVSAVLNNQAEQTKLAAAGSQGVLTPEAESRGPVSPFSYLALRGAVTSEGEVELPQVPTGTGAGAPRTDRMQSVGQMLRDQRGL